MNKYIVILLLILSWSSFADLAAYNKAVERGDYAATAKELRLMDDEGIVGAQFGLV